jgi:hypothetical protein
MKRTTKPITETLYSPRRTCLPTCLIALSIGLLANASRAQDSLPPVRRLIEETLALCNTDREDNAEPLNELAAAQCYLGDFTAAKKTILPPEFSDFRVQVAHLNCAQIEIELTGSIASIPDSLWKIDPGTMRCKAALAFIERGEIDKALEQIDRIPESVQSPLSVFGNELIRELKERDLKEACRKVALAWASHFERAESITAYRYHYHVPQLVAWLVEFDERLMAKILCQKWHSTVKAETNVNEHGGNIGKAWAEYAKAVAALGDRTEASVAFDQAKNWLEKWRAFEFNPTRRGFYRNVAEAYAAVAARQAVVLGSDAAIAVYDQAYEFARLSVDRRDSQFGDFAFESIVSEQLMAGDDRVGGGVAAPVLSHHRTYSSYPAVSVNVLTPGIC